MLHTTEVSVGPGRGRCLFAARNLELGDLIFETKPVGAVLEEGQARAHCAGCFASIGNNRDGRGSCCSGCKKIWYCSRSCQKLDWTDHKPECKAWTGKKQARTPTRTLRLAGRILHAMNSISGDRETASCLLREDVADLVDHNDRRRPEQKEQYELMAAFVARMCVAGSGKRTLLWPSVRGRGYPGLVEAAYAVIGKISCNVFSVTSDTGPTVVGCGLYIQASTVNHSCRPNATQSFNGRSLALRCTRPILKGEEITIGITELHKPRAARRQSLRANYFFECRCERCAPEEAAAAEDARLNGYACPTPNCTGVCTNRKSNAAGGYPSKSADEAGDNSGLATHALSDMVDSGVLLCDSCGASRPGEETEREGRAIGELLERGRALARDGRTSQEGKQCLQEACERATRCLHRANWVLSEIYTELSSVCLEAQDLDAAARYACDGIDTHRACLSGLLPYFSPWATSLSIAGKLVLCVRRQPQKALPLLEEALSCIQVTHGQKHPLCREIRDLVDQARTGG